MSDARLRELERRWLESGSLEDQAAWLNARVAAGELARERLELAARCGHEGALQALSGPWRNRATRFHAELRRAAEQLLDPRREQFASGCALLAAALSDGGWATQVLLNLDVRLERLRRDLLEAQTMRDAATLPLAELLAAARREADELETGGWALGPEHVLLAALRSEVDAAGEVLREHGLAHDDTREELRELLDPGRDARSAAEGRFASLRLEPGLLDPILGDGEPPETPKARLAAGSRQVVAARARYSDFRNCSIEKCSPGQSVEPLRTALCATTRERGIP